MTLRVTPGELVEASESSGRPGLLGKAPHWGRVRLGDVADVINGAAFKSQHFNTQGDGMPLIRIRDVGTDGPGTWYDGPWEESFVVKRGDILVGMDGDFRVAPWRSEPGLLNQRVCRIAVDPERYEQRFLLLVLQGYLDAIWAATSSTTVKHLSSRSIADIPLPQPGLDEQRRIVDILEDHLSRLDAAVAQLRLASRRAVKLERAAIDSVFVERAGREGWPEKTLGELAADERGSITDGPFGSNLARRHYTDSGPRVIRLQNIGDGEYKPADAFVSEEHFEALSKHAASEGDVVIASLGESLPRAAVVPDLGGHAIVKADCVRVRLRPGIDPWWIVYACRSTRSKQWADNHVHGVGRQRLGLTGIRNLPVPFPADEVVRREATARIVDTLDAGRKLQASIEVQLLRNEGLRRALLSAAFSGNLRRTPMNTPNGKDT